MQRIKRRIFSFAGGAAYMAAAIVFSRLLIRNLSCLFSLVSGYAGIDKALSLEITQVLSQFSSASLCSPWLIACLSGAVLGFLFSPVFKKKRPVSNLMKGILLFLAFVLLVPAFMLLTFINDILLLDALKVLVPIVGAL